MPRIRLRSAAASSTKPSHSGSRARPRRGFTICSPMACRSTAISKAGSQSGAKPHTRRGASCMCAATGAGAAIIAALSDAVRRTPSIRLIEGFVAEALLTEDGAVTGLQLREAGNFAARPILLAARDGGAGHGRHRPSLRRHHQSARGQRIRPCDRRTRGRGDRRSRVRAISPDRHHGRPRSGAARHGSACAAKARR